MEKGFHNRAEAGRLLAGKLAHYAHRDDLMVLGLPRGGVPVAFEVAHSLHAPLDVFIVRKLGVPGYEEVAMGAIASGGVRVLNRNVVMELRDADAVLADVTQRESIELERREREYREGRPPPDLRGKVVILVDDGLATGATMRAAVTALRKLKVDRIVVAMPVVAPESCARFSQEVDEVVYVIAPAGFRAVGQFYHDFSQTTDDEVRELLEVATHGLAA
ncbi:MAG: putative phosphoribosyl transferase [Verrucomicrobiaceae bacterium]|nr:putative phosphoribosyl transferase [Verrucomicrobiaceae bacterium]